MTTIRPVDPALERPQRPEVGRIYPVALPPSLRRTSLAVGGPQPAVWSIAGARVGDQSHPLVGGQTPSRSAQTAAGSPPELDDGTLAVRRTGSWSDPVALKLGGPVMSVGFTPDSRWLVAQGGERSAATLHVLANRDVEGGPAPAHTKTVSPSRVSPDSRFLLTHTRR